MQDKDTTITEEKSQEKEINHINKMWGDMISEAVEASLQDEKAKYTLGSVLNHVLLHQTVISVPKQKGFIIKVYYSGPSQAWHFAEEVYHIGLRLIR